jgi:hypothetical protein
MWLRSSLLLFVACCCQAQTAITALSSYWRMEVTDTDRILWDYHGSRHGTFTGAGLETPGTIFGRGVRQNGSATGGVSIPASLVNTTGSFSMAIWCRHAGAATIVARAWAGNSLWTVSFNPSRAQWAGRVMPSGTYNKSAGDLALVWIAYDGTNTRIAVDDSAWTSGAAPDGFTNTSNSVPLEFAQNQQIYNRGATVGDVMFWDGYLPSDAERAAIWNSGSGRDYTYFNAAGYTPPARPLTVSLVDEAFAADTDLDSQGLYFLRPYPLKIWASSLVSGRGDYVWLRSTDHQGGGDGYGGIWRGYSNSPEALPASWTKILSANDLSVSDPTYNWSQLETPYLEYEPTTELFHLYGHAVRNGSSNPTIQVTHVWTSADLSMWTWQGQAFPNAAGRNHTGYAIVERRGTGDWIANTLLTDSGASPPSLSGFWTSVDGITWTLTEAETATADDVFSSQKMPYTEMSRTQRLNSASYVTAGSFIASKAIGTDWVMQYPQWPLFQHDGTGSGGDWLQDVRAYEENGTVWLYAKWSYQEPSTVRLYKGALPATHKAKASGGFRLSGNISIQ